MYYKDAERMQDHIKKHAQKKPVYAKPILEMTPEDIEDATTLYVVKTRVMYGTKSAGTQSRYGVEKNMYGNNVYYLPDSAGYRYRLDVGEDYYFKHHSGTPNKTELLKQIINHAIRPEGEMVSVYYVMNATNEAEAVRCITDVAMSTDIFKKVKVEDIRSKYHHGGKTKRRQTKKRQTKKRQTKKRQTKKRQTKKRQTKKRQTTTFKKMDIKIFSKAMS